jgi:hypothetical protein
MSEQDQKPEDENKVLQEDEGDDEVRDGPSYTSPPLSMRDPFPSRRKILQTIKKKKKKEKKQR